MRRSSAAVLCTLVLLTFVPLGEAAAQATEVAPRNWWLDGWVGLGSADAVGETRGTLASGVTALRGIGPGFALGLGADTASTMGEEGHGFAGALGGLCLRQPRVTVHILGEYGAHRIDGIGRTFPALTANTYPSVTLPYVGARFGLDFHLGGAQVFSLGLWGLLRADQGHRRVLVADQVTLFGGTRADQTYAVGGSSAALGMRFGVALP